MTKCIYCSREFISASGCGVHQVYCKLNPNRKIKTPVKNKHGQIWNKGLTKETSEAVRRQSESLSKHYESNPGSWTGKTHTEEQKKQISESRKRYLMEHPDQVPYLLNHSSNQSYPERYFQALFEREHIDLKYHLQVGLYELDFYNEEKMIDVEIDGEQHYIDPKMPEHDQIRTENLEKLGWTIYRIRWSHYKKLSDDEKKVIIKQIKDMVD